MKFKKFIWQKIEGWRFIDLQAFNTIIDKNASKFYTKNIFLNFNTVCNSYCIGQTQSLKERISSHKSKIKNFVPFSDQFDAISTHFNLKFHSLDHHFSFYVLQSELIESFERLNMEMFFINLFKNIKINLINDDIPSIYFRISWQVCFFFFFFTHAIQMF